LPGAEACRYGSGFGFGFGFGFLVFWFSGLVLGFDFWFLGGGTTTPPLVVIGHWSHIDEK